MSSWKPPPFPSRATQLACRLLARARARAGAATLSGAFHAGQHGAAPGRAAA